MRVPMWSDEMGNVQGDGFKYTMNKNQKKPFLLKKYHDKLRKIIGTETSPTKFTERLYFSRTAKQTNNAPKDIFRVSKKLQTKD